jgi:hypothetical protein
VEPHEWAKPAELAAKNQVRMDAALVRAALECAAWTVAMPASEIFGAQSAAAAALARNARTLRASICWT